MNPKIFLYSMCLIAAAAMFGSYAGAQDIRVTKRPSANCGEGYYEVYDSWWVSAALRDDSTPSMLGSRFDNLPAAQAYARKWLTSNHATHTGNSANAWTRIKFIEIEGEPSCRQKNGPSLPSFEDVTLSEVTGLVTDSLKAKKAVDGVMQKTLTAEDTLIAGLAKAFEPGKLSSVLSGYMKEAANAYERAKTLKEKALSNQQKITDDVFKNVNQAIDDYNTKRELVVTESKGKLATLPKMTRITPGMIDQTKNWGTAMQMEAELNSEREALLAEKAALDGEYNAVGSSAWNRDVSESNVRNVRKLANGPGPFRARPPGDVVVDGVFLGFRSYETYEAAREFAREDGIVLDANDNRVTKAPTPLATIDDVINASTEHDRHVQETDQRVADYQSRLANYESRLKAYNTKMAQYQQLLAELRKMGYQRPKFPRK